MTKRNARRALASAWSAAVAEGRIVNHNGGQTKTMYPTVAAAEAAVDALHAAGDDDAAIVKATS